MTPHLDPSKIFTEYDFRNFCCPEVSFVFLSSYQFHRVFKPTQDVLYNFSSVCTTDKSLVMQQVFHLVCYICLCQLGKSSDFHDAVFTFVHQMCPGSGMNTSQLICLSPLSDVMCRECHSHGRLRL